MQRLGCCFHIPSRVLGVPEVRGTPGPFNKHDSMLGSFCESYHLMGGGIRTSVIAAEFKYQVSRSGGKRQEEDASYRYIYHQALHAPTKPHAKHHTSYSSPDPDLQLSIHQS